MKPSVPGKVFKLFSRADIWSAYADDAQPAEVAEHAGAERITGVYWLRRNAKRDRLVKRFLPLFTVFNLICLILIAGLAWFIGILPVPDDPSKAAELYAIRRIVVMMVIWFAAILPLVRMGQANMMKQLGTDGTYLYVRHPDGRRETMVPEYTVYSPGHIMGDRVLVAVRTGKGQPLYEQGELARYALPLLARGRRLNSLQMFWHMLKNREPQTVLLLLLFTGTALYLYATGLWRAITA